MAKITDFDDMHNNILISLKWLIDNLGARPSQAPRLLRMTWVLLFILLLPNRVGTEYTIKLAYAVNFVSIQLTTFCGTLEEQTFGLSPDPGTHEDETVIKVIDIYIINSNRSDTMYDNDQSITVDE